MNQYVTRYMIRIKTITDFEYLERNKLFVENYLKNTYNNDENYREHIFKQVLFNVDRSEMVNNIPCFASQYPLCFTLLRFSSTTHKKSTQHPKSTRTLGRW